MFLKQKQEEVDAALEKHKEQVALLCGDASNFGQHEAALPSAVPVPDDDIEHVDFGRSEAALPLPTQNRYSALADEDVTSLNCLVDSFNNSSVSNSIQLELNLLIPANDLENKSLSELHCIQGPAVSLDWDEASDISPSNKLV